jgi:iron complex outermembrane recepter protein
VVHLDLPEFGNVSFKIDGIIARRGGTVKNSLQGASDYNSFDRRGIHVEALWKPGPTFTVDGSFDTGYDATTTLYQQLIGAPFAVAASTSDPAIPANVLAAVATVSTTRIGTAPIGGSEQPSIGKTIGGRVNLEWQATPDLLLKSISAYRELTQGQYDNAGIASSFVARPSIAGTGFTGAGFQRYSLAFFRQNQLSEELQAFGEFDRVKYSLGALYYEERVEDSAQAPVAAYFGRNQADSAVRKPLPLFTADGTSYLTFALDEVNRNWGSVEGYLAAEADVNKADLVRLRAAYTE